jgi:acid phosphatase type 7
MKKTLILCLLFISISLSLKGEETSPACLYLTWQHDPTQTMTIQWHTPDDSGELASSRVFYRIRGDEQWQEAEGKSHPIAPFKVRVHTVELIDLKPDTTYDMRLDSYSDSFLFRTLPDRLWRPVRFVAAGDVYLYLRTFKKMNQQIAKSDPDFVLVGGDIAYTVGLKRKAAFKRWQTFLQQWKQQMISPDGRLIPLVPILGNHDVKRAREGRPADDFLFEFFALSREKTFRSLDCGNYMSLFLLDSGHWNAIEGEQTEWLKKSLEERASVPYKFAAYHLSAYPSVYDHQDKSPTKLRTHWSPLLEKAHVDGVFEHHNHAFKRTHPLKAGKIDPDGIVYLGDGAWGISPRHTTALHKAWYLAKTGRQNCFWLTTIDEKGSSIEAFGLKGQSLDRLTIKAKEESASPLSSAQ